MGGGRWRVRGIALSVALVLTSAGCAGEAEAPAPSRSATIEGEFPVRLRAANGSVTIERRPARIVSLSPTATEMLFAIGAGDQVVAVDEQSSFPPEAPRSDLSGFEPNVEAIAEHEPDLVVVSNDLNEVVASLGALDIPVLLQPAAETLEDVYGEIEQLGAATGNVAGAARVVARMRSEIEKLVGSVPQLEPRATYYHELDPTFYSVTSRTFIGQVYGLVGLESIADAAGKGGDYPQLSAEFIVQSDPDLIFLADTRCCGVTAEKVAKRPGWDEIRAVRTGAVIELDDDVASRWGPRVVEFLRFVVQGVRALEPAA